MYYHYWIFNNEKVKCVPKHPQRLQSSTRDNVICMITGKESYAIGVQSTVFSSDQKGLPKWKPHLCQDFRKIRHYSGVSRVHQEKEDSPTNMGKRLKMTETLDPKGNRSTEWLEGWDINWRDWKFLGGQIKETEQLYPKDNGKPQNNLIIDFKRSFCGE